MVGGSGLEYSKLKFTNNFVFCKVLENNLDLCRELLELILKVKIKKVELADKEKVLDITPDGKELLTNHLSCVSL